MAEEELRRVRVKQTLGQENHFHRLPMELFLSILDRLSDLKSLIQCSLVSKHFALVVSYVQSVSITIPGNALSRDDCGKLCELEQSLKWATSEQLPLIVEHLSLQNLQLPKFLEKFRELENIYVEFSLPSSPHSSFPKWKAKFAGNKVELEGLLAVFSTSVRKGTKDDLEQDVSTAYVPSHFEDCIWSSYGRYVEWVSLVWMLAKTHTSLRRVTVADTEKQGKLVITDEQLCMMRSFSSDDGTASDHFQSGMKAAWIPQLHLPLSGYIMKGVAIVFLKVVTEPCTGTAPLEDDFELMSWDFEDDEKLFGEALTVILKNHRNSFTPLVSSHSNNLIGL